MCGYACVNCGKCKGEVRPLMKAGYCPVCKATNSPDALECASCGAKLPRRPGQDSAEHDS